LGGIDDDAIETTVRLASPAALLAALAQTTGDLPAAVRSGASLAASESSWNGIGARSTRGDGDGDDVYDQRVDDGTRRMAGARRT